MNHFRFGTWLSVTVLSLLSGFVFASGLPAIADKPGFQHPGTFVWFDLITPDRDRVRAYYAELFGWEIAEAEGFSGYDMIINIEPHGYYTTKPEFMERMLNFFDTPHLRMNMDTGNTFIAGQDPVAFLDKFKDRVSHVHIKDVSESLAAAARGELTGIAVSATAIGDGVNVDNIKRCIDILVDIGYDGVFSIECEGEGGPMIEKSLAWVRDLVDDANARIAAKG